MLHIFIIFILLKIVFPKKSQYKLDIYFGVPGSGKSTFAAKLAKEAMRESKIITFSKNYPCYLSSFILKTPFFKRSVKVYSNLPIIGAYKLDPREDLGTYLVEHCLIILDEAGIEYNSRDFKNFPVNNRTFFKFLRHEYTTVALFSQSPEDMDKVIRELATNRFIVTRSLFPNTFVAKRVRKSIGVDEKTRKLMTIDHKPTPFIDWNYCYGPAVWDFFDSFSRLGLPEKPDGWRIYESHKKPKKSKWSKFMAIVTETLLSLVIKKDSILLAPIILPWDFHSISSSLADPFQPMEVKKDD